MANAVYPLFLERLWKGDIDTDVDTFKVALVTSAYTYSDAHEFYSSLSGVLGSVVLSSITITSGLFDAADALLTGLAAGVPHAAVIYKDTGVAGTSRLFLYLDTGTGFDVLPSGDVAIVWSNDANSKIFPLGGRAA